MKLSALCAQIPGSIALPAMDPEITGVACDSRQVKPGDLFVAVRGEHSDGHAWLEAAAKAGAAACLVEEPVETFGMERVLVTDAEEALGWVSAAFWDHPSRKLTLVGITGTNGKTTTAHMLQHILAQAGVVTGRLGTVGYAFPSGEEVAPLTTPDAPTLQGALARMVEEGAGAAVAEISSHALIRKRAVGCSFACTVFTNLSQDHLDFHGTMEEYFEAKKLLFTDHPRLAEAVVNVDDGWGRALAPDLGGHVVTYGLEEGDVRFSPEQMDETGITGTVWYPGGQRELRLPLAGSFNAQNAAAALGVAWALGLDIERAIQALESAPQTPGRLEAVENDRGVGIYVDYAHTPEAVDRALEAVKAVTGGRVLCLLGCGGDRDRAKRPLMGAAATRWADLLVLTADNSRSEPTGAILDEIETGLPGDWQRIQPEAAVTGKSYIRIEDREAAIRWAVAQIQPGDALLVAGKGHETTQTIGGVVSPFDDRQMVRQALAELNKQEPG